MKLEPLFPGYNGDKSLFLFIGPFLPIKKKQPANDETDSQQGAQHDHESWSDAIVRTVRHAIRPYELYDEVSVCCNEGSEPIIDSTEERGRPTEFL